ncbi:MAG: class I SAM-dependent methyltransferase [Ilumatobacteraceae bacterium]
MSDTSPHHGPVGNAFDKYAAANPVERLLMQRFLAAFDSLLPAVPPLRVLEVGVGEGEILQRVQSRFPHASCRGIDVPNDSLLPEWERRGIAAEFGNVEQLRFDDRSFDLVLAIEVLEHVDDVEAALREISRVCAGVAVMSVPFEPIWRLGNVARGRYLRQFGNTPGHVNHWSRRSFHRVVSRYFAVERVLSPLPWTMLRAVPRP